MNKLKRKDENNRKKFKEVELKAVILKNIQINLGINANVRFKSIDNAIEFNRNVKKTHINTHCIKTISKKTVHKKFKLARTELLRLIRLGKIAGFKKAVW